MIGGTAPEIGEQGLQRPGGGGDRIGPGQPATVAEELPEGGRVDAEEDRDDAALLAGREAARDGGETLGEGDAPFRSAALADLASGRGFEHGADQGFVAVEAGEQDLDLRQDLRFLAGKDGAGFLADAPPELFEEVGLGGEVAVDGADADAGAGGDGFVGEGGGGVAGEQLVGGVEDLGAGGGGVAFAEGPRGIHDSIMQKWQLTVNYAGPP